MLVLRDPTWQHKPPFEPYEHTAMWLITSLCLLILATPFLLLLALVLLT